MDDGCNGVAASFLSLDFRYIPVVSSNQIYMSTINTIILADSNNYGLLLSNNYPNYETNGNYKKTLQTFSTNKAFKVYITDISIEDSLG